MMTLKEINAQLKSLCEKTPGLDRNQKRRLKARVVEELKKRYTIPKE